MTDSARWQAAAGQAEIALALLRQPPPADVALRRRQMVRAAKDLEKAVKMLWPQEGD